MEKKNLELIPHAIAIIPALAFYSAYVYERGYCISFGLPIELISVDLNRILRLSFDIFIVFSTLYAVAYITPFPRVNSYYVVKYGGYWYVTVACIAGGSGILWVDSGLTLQVAGPIFSLCIIAILLMTNENVKFSKRFRALADEIENEHLGLTDDEILDKTAKKLGVLKDIDVSDNSKLRNIFLASLLFICFYQYNFLAGRGDARRQTDFFEVTSHKGLMIIRKYNETLLCRKYDKKGKYWTDSIVTISVTSKDLPLKLVTIEK